MFKKGMAGMVGMAIESRTLTVWAFQNCHTSAIPLIQGMAGMAVAPIANKKPPTQHRIGGITVQPLGKKS
jgi:hypothetical protein